MKIFSKENKIQTELKRSQGTWDGWKEKSKIRHNVIAGIWTFSPSLGWLDQWERQTIAISSKAKSWSFHFNYNENTICIYVLINVDNAKCIRNIKETKKKQRTSNERLFEFIVPWDAIFLCTTGLQALLYLVLFLFFLCSSLIFMFV